MTRQVNPLPKSPKAKKPAKRLQAKRATTTAEVKRQADRLWGELIHARDRCCRICGRTDGKLDAHHIMPRTFAATRCVPENGIKVCFRCHRYVCHGTDPFAAVLEYERLLGHDGYRMMRERAYAGCRANKQFWLDAVDELTAALKEVR